MAAARAPAAAFADHPESSATAQARMPGQHDLVVESPRSDHERFDRPRQFESEANDLPHGAGGALSPDRLSSVVSGSDSSFSGISPVLAGARSA
jgi:hypothetical protein